MLKAAIIQAKYIVLITYITIFFKYGCRVWIKPLEQQKEEKKEENTYKIEKVDSRKIYDRIMSCFDLCLSQEFEKL